MPNFDYRLKLLPDTSTVVEIPVSLNASPLEGMNSDLRIAYYASSPTGISPTIDAPVQVGARPECWSGLTPGAAAGSAHGE